MALTFWVSFASFHALFGVKVSVPLHDALHENYLGFSKDTTVKQIVNLVQLIEAFFIVCGPTSDNPNFNFLNGFLSLAKDLLLFYHLKIAFIITEANKSSIYSLGNDPKVCSFISNRYVMVPIVPPSRMETISFYLNETCTYKFNYHCDLIHF